METIIITGGAGFIGSALIRLLISQGQYRVVNLDKLTYAANLNSLASVDNDPNYCFELADICDGPAVGRLLDKYQPTAIMHLAAESHVDRSIDGPGEFINTNIVGTYTLLETALKYWQGLQETAKERFRFHHVSTDEVYGSLGHDDKFHEDTPYRPNSPYASSKASSDLLVRAWHKTYGLPVVISNCSNNYGPYQFPEKLIPLMIIKALAGERLPVYGKGDNIRDWLYVDDHAQALTTILRQGAIGQTYNIGGNCEMSNLEIVHMLCGEMDKLVPDSPHRPHARLVTFVNDRPGHDFRYAIDCSKLTRELGWSPSESLDSGLAKTVCWYLQNRQWWQDILDNRYRGERLGLTEGSDKK